MARLTDSERRALREGTRFGKEGAPKELSVPERGPFASDPLAPEAYLRFLSEASTIFPSQPRGPARGSNWQL